MKQFLYWFENYKSSGLVRVFAKKKPSLETIPRSGAWVLNEWHRDKFEMPCFPEVTWGIINKNMMFIGELKCPKKGAKK